MNNHNIQLNKTYDKLKNIFNGALTKKDCFTILNNLNIKDIIEQRIAINIINSKKFGNHIDYVTFNKYLTELNNCSYREEATLKLNNMIKETSDLSQIKTLTRVCNMKPIRPIEMLKNNISTKEDLVVNFCPHCSKDYKLPRVTNYIICGHEGNQFDWSGCGRDWCFSCGKMLCKTWEEDLLYHYDNQIHDSKCCKIHAEQNNHSYPDDYCQCINKNVKRNITLNLFE